MILISALGKTQFVQGQSDYSTIIDATVKISICGNEIIEGGEDCEGLNLNGGSCTSLSYSGGDLTCDIACTFDVTECIVPTPIPTTPTRTTGIPMIDQSPQPTISPTPGRSIFRVFPTNLSFLETSNLLPPALQVFDFYGAGRIFMQDLSAIVKMWVDDWRQYLQEDFSEGVADTTNKSCDLNEDRECDLKDFSILMYYVERE